MFGAERAFKEASQSALRALANAPPLLPKWHLSRQFSFLPATRHAAREKGAGRAATCRKDAGATARETHFPPLSRRASPRLSDSRSSLCRFPAVFSRSTSFTFLAMFNARENLSPREKREGGKEERGVPLSLPLSCRYFSAGSSLRLLFPDATRARIAYARV